MMREACPREPRPRNCDRQGSESTPSNTLFWSSKKKLKKTTQSHKWIPKCVNFGPKMVTKTDPFLLFVPSCCFSWFCYPSQAVCLLLGPWGTRNRAKKSSGNLSENTPLKKHKIKGSRPSLDDFWVQKWVPKGESIGLLGVFFNTLGATWAT